MQTTHFQIPNLTKFTHKISPEPGICGDLALDPVVG